MRLSIVTAVLGLLLLPAYFHGAMADAQAQEASNSSATYGAWMVRCKREKEANLCEMLQSLAVGNDRKIVAQVAIGQLPNAKTPRAVLQLPMGVDLTKPPALLIGETAEYPGRYFICAGRFCRAEIELPASAAAEIGKAKKASLRFTLLGKTILMTVTTEGMATAFEKAVRGAG